MDEATLRYDAVLFDNDGVIVERTSDGVMEPAVCGAFRELGVDDPDPHHVDYLIRGPMDEIEDVCESYGLDPERLWDEREARAAAGQAESIRNGGKPLYDDVAAVADLPLSLGIVSNNQSETIDFVVDFYDLDWLDFASGREMSLEGVHRKKPEPYYLNRALDELGVGSALYVGDSAVDVAAADAAGIDSAFIRRPHRADYDLPHEPTYEIDSLDEIPGLVRGATVPE
ncbi:HAD family hydrolase [Halostella sp. JP-L12]|uniref:HAD family hydrolase n=1 Tax=Halostella TaxID=1843185 RepID=UPI000EF84788|nr:MULTISPECIES: HAD-IA family hydrolase [Halostella]NHN46776.1 HAD family hydrolase [Halostella sp. JP-L12]